MLVRCRLLAPLIELVTWCVSSAPAMMTWTEAACECRDPWDSVFLVVPDGRRIHMGTSDPLVPPSALLPLAATHCGGQRPVEHVPGSLRPFSATLAIVPLPCGKHHTTATRWDKTEGTQKSRDGVVEPDSVVITQTDS